MAEFHFVEDYQRLIKRLVEQYPLDEAMALAVGGGIGSFEAVGSIEADVMIYAGLDNGSSLLDLGCGSGRLAVAISNRLEISYCGVDVVQELLDYAASKTPSDYKFLLNHNLRLPVSDSSIDYFSAFSVFTHLLHSETYLYLEEALRALKPGGKVVFSFLEFSNADHWPSFWGEVCERRALASVHLNIMIERAVIKLWAAKLGFVELQIIDGHDSPWGSHAMGQALAIMRKPY